MLKQPTFADKESQQILNTLSHFAEIEIDDYLGKNAATEKAGATPVGLELPDSQK